MKWRIAKKALRNFERGLAYDLEEYFSHAESAAGIISGKDGVELFRGCIILLIEKLSVNSVWPFKERWIDGVGWSSMVATDWGRVTGLGEFWWGDANDYSAGLVPEPLQVKLQLLSLQKRKPISYWIKFGSGAHCYRIIGPKDASINAYSIYSSGKRSEFVEAPLVQVASEGDIATVNRLLEAGEDPNERTLDGFTALMLASMFGHGEVAQVLLSNGANPSIQAEDGVTALLLAARFGHLDVVNKLLVAGCDVAFKDQYGQTALNLACNRDYVEFRPYNEIAKLLRNAGATE